MFSLHATGAITRNAHTRIERLHHEARVETSLSSPYASSRFRVASVLRRIAAWNEPHRATVRAATLHRPPYGSD
jgi:hypothetical protein